MRRRGRRGSRRSPSAPRTRCFVTCAARGGAWRWGWPGRRVPALRRRPSSRGRWAPWRSRSGPRAPLIGNMNAFARSAPDQPTPSVDLPATARPVNSAAPRPPSAPNRGRERSSALRPRARVDATPPGPRARLRRLAAPSPAATRSPPWWRPARRSRSSAGSSASRSKDIASHLRRRPS